MVGHRNLGTIPASVPAMEFFDKCISKRVPVVITGLPDDENFKARSWTDLDYLAARAGNSQVLVEPMHPTSRQFGTDVERITMPFSEFISSLKQADGPHHYLTTQYADQDADEQTVLPPPADALVDDYPQVPRIMGNLCLQQVNLWLGRSKDGSTSGLHHDFHDNLYCLLRGRKRFVLYPPPEVKKLYPHGVLDTLHDNGLISYVDAPVRPDGLPVRAALKVRVKAIERQLDAMPKGKGKAKQDTKERKALVKAHDEALDELAQFTLQAGDGIDVEDEVDDFDALMADLEGVGADEDDSSLNHTAPANDEEENSDDDDDDDENEDEGDAPFPQNDTRDDEPSSFSKIPTALVHQHLGLPTTAVAPPDISMADFPDFQKIQAPFVVELNAGDMLCLPASWWHEVTSSSGADDAESIHMAFNYWFYPPDQLDRFEEPYEDKLVWDYFRFRRQETAEEQAPLSSGKRKNETVDALANKKSRR